LADVGQWSPGGLESINQANHFPHGSPGSIPGIGVQNKNIYKYISPKISVKDG
jgi:hypothetical protein